MGKKVYSFLAGHPVGVGIVGIHIALVFLAYYKQTQALNLSITAVGIYVVVKIVLRKVVAYYSDDPHAVEINFYRLIIKIMFTTLGLFLFYCAHFLTVVRPYEANENIVTGRQFADTLAVTLIWVWYSYFFQRKVLIQKVNTNGQSL